MERSTTFRVRPPENPTTVGRLVLVSWTLTLAFMSATEMISHYLEMSSSLLGYSTGVLVGCLIFYIVDGTNLRRLSIGLLGLISSTTIVIDITGQFIVLDGFAHVPGMFGMILALGVMLHTILGDNEPITAIRYFFVGLVCVGVATIRLALEWGPRFGAISSSARTQHGLLLLSGLGVLTVGVRIWDDADSAGPQE